MGETQVAIKFCVKCDEAFCDTCWRKVHSKGKRLKHPFYDVNEEGQYSDYCMTIDGEYVNPDELYKWDESTSNSQYFEGGGGDNQEVKGQEYEDQQSGDQWEEYLDENQTQYWYNSIDGTSTYQNPFEDHTATSSSYQDPNQEQEQQGEEWTHYLDDQGNGYWYNNFTGETSYET